jgi:protease-4
MKMRDSLKNLFAAVGAVVFILLVLTFLVAVFSDDRGMGFGDKVGVITIEGVITESAEINRQIVEFRDREDVTVVLLRVDSPGGAVGPAQEIYREVKKLKEKKPVVVSMGTVAASGGYYIAAPANKIVANPGTITGSIGVIIEFVNIEGLFTKIGLKGNVIKSGEFKDTGSPMRPMRDDELKLIQGVIDDVHSQFVDAVADGRSMDKSKAAAISDGRIFSGAQAEAAGLVDELGNLNDAIELGAELGGIEGEPTVIYAEDRTKGLWGALSGKSTRSYSELFRGVLPGGVRIMYLFNSPLSSPLNDPSG